MSISDVAKLLMCKLMSSEYAGRVRAVNADWGFCIIELARRDLLNIGDKLLVRSSTSLDPIGKLQVSKVEGNQVVADAVGELPLEDVRAGFKTYHWKTVEVEAEELERLNNGDLDSDAGRD